MGEVRILKRIVFTGGSSDPESVVMNSPSIPSYRFLCFGLSESKFRTKRKKEGDEKGSSKYFVDITRSVTQSMILHPYLKCLLSETRDLFVFL